ncbi:MAG: RidA family protein [Gammaproteobacteria bacterium]
MRFSLLRMLLLIPFALAAGCAVNLSAPQSATQSAPERDLVEYFRSPGSRLPFSPAVRVGDVVYLSGQIGATADGQIPVGIEAQARAAMDNLKASARLAGVTMDDMFKCLVMLDDMSQWGEFNKVYVTYFKPDRLPARSAFGADGLALGATLEVECMAVAPRKAGAR